MKAILILFVLAAALSSAVAQKTELKINLNSGLFYFNGGGGSTWINLNGGTNGGYANDPYGSLPALCYGASIHLQRVNRVKFLLGIGAGYEVLRGMKKVNYTFDEFTVEASGKIHPK